MDMKRVEEIKETHEDFKKRIIGGHLDDEQVDDLFGFIERQQEQIERYEKVLSKISESDESDVFAYAEECEMSARKALEES